MLAACATCVDKTSGCPARMSETSKRKRGCFLISALRRPEGSRQRAVAISWSGLGQTVRLRSLARIKGCRCSDIFACRPGRRAGDRHLLSPTVRPPRPSPSPKDVLKTYADIAQAGYADCARHRAHAEARGRCLPRQADRRQSARRPRRLDRRAHPLHADRGLPLRQPDRRRLGRPREFLAARRGPDRLRDASSYGTDSSENELYTANVIANTSLTIGGKKIDTSKITKELLADKLQEAGGVEANVATGYHAIEFLLWGQDLNGTGPGNGNRPATDYDLKNCTHGHCDRRAAISPRRDRSPRRRPRLDGGAMGARRRGAQDGHGRQRRGGPDRDHDRARQPVLWRACRRAHEARAHDPRSRGGARLLLRQHPRLAFLRRARHPQRLSRHLSSRRPLARDRSRASRTWSRRSRPRSMPRCGPSSTPP